MMPMAVIEQKVYTKFFCIQVGIHFQIGSASMVKYKYVNLPLWYYIISVKEQ